MLEPLHTCCEEIVFNMGLGLIVITYSFGIPAHPFIDGAIRIVPEMGWLVVLTAVNVGILPEPLKARPIAVLELVHVNCVPDGRPLRFSTGTVDPTQYDTFGNTLETNAGV